ALNVILSAIAPVKSKGVITANIISNFTNKTPGIVGAYCVNGASHGIPLRNIHCKFPTSPVLGAKAKLKTKVNQNTLKKSISKNILKKIETVFFFLSKPASNNPNEGII